MTLVSNNRTSVANRIGLFETEFPKKYELDETWYVGLTELAYTKSWFNVMFDCKVMLVDHNNKYYPANEVIRKGYYPNERELERVINTVLTGIECSVRSYPYIKFDVTSRRVHVQHGLLEDGTALYAWFDKDLADMLGLNFHGPDETTTMDESGTWRQNTIKPGFTSINSYDLTAGVHSIFVYCDIIEPVFVGDCFTNCIRSVSINQEEDFGRDCEKIFNPIQYHKLGRSNFQSIVIGLIDDSGNNINFNFGRSKVVLHFKKQDATWMGGAVLP